ncbi:hypothetical protein BRAO375_170018 [Bradyrhizobium sp. ORS 375]|uniref:hypothetical protein n=1 Tax=Bradyrhizobium sp. (strain ORS 375) TaxID=566679 RepID=UPI000240A708|nr:hypothetical protein [Bradyrhizobium sp. ORS 375]CCD91725.1 hypothetical protein BRAO375_170018 [Bradyrhizobium sp. ORS 375]
MQDAEKSNVVQFRDYVSRRADRAAAEPSAAGGGTGRAGAILVWPRGPMLYPGGIDDLPV